LSRRAAFYDRNVGLHVLNRETAGFPVPFFSRANNQSVQLGRSKKTTEDS